MGRFAFISDFDGTISHVDFFIQILRSRLPEREAETLAALRSGTGNDFDILNSVFSSMNLDEPGFEDEIARIPVDEDFPALVADVERLGGDFFILSAGCVLYARKTLERLGLTHIRAYGNPGVYDAAVRGLVMRRDTEAFWYSPRYGVDKSAVVASLTGYDQLFYAGDSVPDVAPGLLCGTRFAKKGLQTLYRERGEEFIPIDGLGDIRRYLAEHPPV